MVRSVGTRTFTRDPGYTSDPDEPPILWNWRAAVGNVRGAVSRGKLVFMGDSTTAGYGAGTGGTGMLNAARARCFPVRTAQILDRGFVETNADTIWGSQNYDSLVTYNAYDPRVVLGTGWSMAGGGTLGDNFFRFTGGATGTLAFTPTLSFDKIEVWYYRASGQGSFTVNVDGGASLGTVDTDGATGFVSTTLTCSAATHTINLNAQADGDIYIGGVVPYLSTETGIDVIVAGWSGAFAATMDDAGAFGPLTALRALAPACTVINLTINDSNAGTDLAAYTAAMELIIAAAQESGDVILMVGPPSNTAAATNGQLDDYIAVLNTLALRYGCVVVDLKERWGSYDAVQSYFPYVDTLHPRAAAYADVGQAVAAALMFS